MAKITGFSVNDLQKGLENALPISGLREKARWVNRQATDEIESVLFEAAIESVGICQVIFPYRLNLADDLDKQVSFAAPLDLNTIGTVSDIRVSLYDGGLSVKIFMEELI